MTALDFPDTPTVGQLYGSSGTVWRWDGARWASTAGASGARGTVAYTQLTSNISGFNSVSQDVGLSATFTAVAGRRYRVKASTLVTATSVPSSATLQIKTGAGVTVQQSGATIEFLNATVGVTAEAVVSPPAGTATYKMWLSRTGNPGGDVNLYADPTFPTFILVEDITYEAGTSGTAGGGWQGQATALPGNVPVVATNEATKAEWANNVQRNIGDIASLPVGSGTGSIANHLYDAKSAASANTSSINTINATINNMLHPPTQAPIGMAGRTVSTTEVEIGRFTTPNQGLYLIGYQLDVAAATAFGFLDFYLKVGVIVAVPLIPGKLFEGGIGSRTAASGLALADFNAGSVVQLMAKTYAGTVTVNSATVTAPLLRTP